MFIKYVGLILVPTRQVVLQIHDSIYEIKSKSNTTSEDLTKLYETMHLIIGTTDRVKKILKRRHGLLNQCRFFTLDEADKLLSKDFQIRINASKDKKSSNLIIFYKISNHKKTFQQKQLPIAEVSNMMNELMLIGLTHYILVDQKDKIKALNTIYSKLQIYQCIIFCGSYTCVEVLSQNL